MNIEAITGCRFRDDDNLALPVEAAGTTLTVKAGQFRYAGQDLRLLEDQVYEVVAPDAAKARSITGYLVIERASNEVKLLVDEVPADGTSPFDFAAQEDFDFVAQLFHVQVPAGTTDPKALTCVVYRVEPRVLQAPARRP